MVHKNFKRYAPDFRKAQILKAAITLANKNHFLDITREQIAKRAKCSPGLITVYFKSMKKLREDIMRDAIKNENLKILFDGIACEDKVAGTAALKLKQKAIHIRFPA